MKLFLLADDDGDDRDIFRDALKEIDKSIILFDAEDGEKAIEKLKKGECKDPSIIFLDINMPNMNGWQCLKKLKQDERFHDIPVIMYSTSSLERERQIATELGALFLITKPKTFAELKNLLTVIVNSSLKNLIEAIKSFYRK